MSNINFLPHNLPWKSHYKTSFHFSTTTHFLKLEETSRKTCWFIVVSTWKFSEYGSLTKALFAQKLFSWSKKPNHLELQYHLFEKDWTWRMSLSTPAHFQIYSETIFLQKSSFEINSDQNWVETRDNNHPLSIYCSALNNYFHNLSHFWGAVIIYT